MLPLWEEVLWPFVDAWDSVRLRTTSTQWNVPRIYGLHGKLFFFLLEREPMVFRDLVRFGPSIPAACRASLPCGSEGVGLCARQRGNSFVGDGFLVPELKDESEASEDDQTDNVSNEA